MWISRREYDRLVERIGDLERRYYDERSYMPAAIPISRLVRLIMEHLGLYYEIHPAKDELLKKGGPERGN